MGAYFKPEVVETSGSVTHRYHAEAQLLSGHLRHPVEFVIEAQAIVALRGAREGRLFRQMQQYSADAMISFQSGYTCVSGSHSQQHGWRTLSTSVLEGLNVFEVLAAERIVAQVSAEHPDDKGRNPEYVPKVGFLGTRFENLRVGGYPVQIELDLGICGDKPKDDQPYLKDRGFLDRVQRQLEDIAGAKGIPESLKQAYDSKIAYIDDLKKRADGRAKGERNSFSKVQCSLVKSIGPIPIPGVRTFGNLIFIPDFGIVSLADVEVGIRPDYESGDKARGRALHEPDDNYFVLTMLHMMMGSVAEGTGVAAKASLGGTTVKAGNGELSDRPSLESSNLSGEKPEGAEGTSTPPLPSEIGNDSAQPDPPRSAYALLKCNDVVIAEIEFALTVGLAKEPDPDISGDNELFRPASSVGPYTLQVQIVADGFGLRLGESWRNELSVTVEKPYPQFTIHLTPEMRLKQNVWSRSIQAIYLVDGHTIGVAIRSVAIVRSKQYLDQATTLAQDSSTTFSIPTDTVAPDLTVSIVHGESEGRLRWTLATPWKDIAVPDAPMLVVVGNGGDTLKDFARQLVDSVNSHEGKQTLYGHLIGRGLEVGDKIPDQFWDVLRLVSQKSPTRLPTILILSEEPYIPWELAVLKPPLNPNLPPFLGAQAVVGRWVLAHRGPKLPPPCEQHVKDIAVVSGVYSNVPGWRRLQQAEDEATEIENRWNGIHVDAATGPVLKCIKGTPAGDLLHFATHGNYDPSSTLNGLILVDGEPLDPTTVKGSNLAGTPFIFLNACQVGQGNAVLGDYAGMAAAFLYAGASGVVAPLWSIKDTIAKEIALSFYSQTFGGTAPAEFLRSERSKFHDSSTTISATCLAYQFFGHPAMRLVREPVKDGDSNADNSEPKR